eukprot:gene4236-20426_t
MKCTVNVRCEPAIPRQSEMNFSVDEWRKLKVKKDQTEHCSISSDTRGPAHKMKDTGIITERGVSTTCYARMNNALKTLKNEMVQLAYLNVQLMEKMMEVQNQIEAIKQNRMDLMLEEYKSELFEKQVEGLIARASSSDLTSCPLSLKDENDNIIGSNESTFTDGSVFVEKNNIGRGRKSTIDSLSSLPSLSSIQSDLSYIMSENDIDDEYLRNKQDTRSSDSGIDVRTETLELDCFLAATTSTL